MLLCLTQWTQTSSDGTIFMRRRCKHICWKMLPAWSRFVGNFILFTVYFGRSMYYGGLYHCGGRYWSTAIWGYTLCGEELLVCVACHAVSDCSIVSGDRLPGLVWDEMITPQARVCIKEQNCSAYVFMELASLKINIMYVMHVRKQCLRGSCMCLE